MAILSELSLAVKNRRSEIGLSQDRVAQLAGLSRASINELETGRMNNLSLNRAEKLANTLGLSLGVTGLRRPKASPDDALMVAARTASVSYRQMLPPEVLTQALRDGAAPPEFMPHLRTLLDEAPLSVLSDVAVALEQQFGIRRQSTWQRMRSLANELACRRDIWA